MRGDKVKLRKGDRIIYLYRDNPGWQHCILESIDAVLIASRPDYTVFYYSKLAARVLNSKEDWL